GLQGVGWGSIAVVALLIVSLAAWLLPGVPRLDGKPLILFGTVLVFTLVVIYAVTDIHWQRYYLPLAALFAIFYGLSLDLVWNQLQGNAPSDDDLHTARSPSAILAALGVIPMFFIGWQLRLRSLAYPSTLIYALHPVILLNGRRAMLEGSLIFFTLATMAWLL